MYIEAVADTCDAADVVMCALHKCATESAGLGLIQLVVALKHSVICMLLNIDHLF